MANNIDKIRQNLSDQEIIEKLRKENQEYEIILDSIPAWVFYKDRENRFIRVNQAFADGMKSTKADLNGKSAFDIFPKEQAEKFWQDDLEIINSGKAKENIIEQMESQAGTLWVETEKIPYRDGAGNIIGVIGFLVDITKNKKLQDELEKVASVIEYTQDLVNIADLEGKMIFLNKAGQKMLGIKNEDVTNYHAMDVVTENFQDLVKNELFPALLSGKNWEGDLRYVNLETGKNIDAHSVCFMIKDKETGKPKYFANVSRDITELKNRMEEAEKMNQMLIGRELKMVQLKEEIEKLKEEKKAQEKL